jgi:hypothetical protein
MIAYLFTDGALGIGGGGHFVSINLQLNIKAAVMLS